MTILADTSALASLFLQNDPNNQNANALLKKIDGYDILITEYVFAEVVTIVSQKVSKKDAIFAGDYLKTHMRFVDISQDTLDLAWEIFKKQTSKNVSFVDCTSFALYQKGIFDKAFTFDQDFKKNKIPILD